MGLGSSVKWHLVFLRWRKQWFQCAKCRTWMCKCLSDPHKQPPEGPAGASDPGVTYTFLNLRATAWALGHMKGNQVETLY